MSTALKLPQQTPVTLESGKNIQCQPGIFERREKHLRHSEYKIYTDGSKKAEGTGGGFVVYYYNKIIHTHSFKM